METIDGVPVSGKQIKDWSDEAEKGYDVERLRKRRHKPGDGEASPSPRRPPT